MNKYSTFHIWLVKLRNVHALAVIKAKMRLKHLLFIFIKELNVHEMLEVKENVTNDHIKYNVFPTLKN